MIYCLKIALEYKFRNKTNGGLIHLKTLEPTVIFYTLYSFVTMSKWNKNKKYIYNNNMLLNYYKSYSYYIIYS